MYPNLSCISISFQKPTYTSIKNFPEDIDGNTMAITLYTMKVGHLVLTQKLSEFKAVGVTLIIPIVYDTSPALPVQFITRI